ncbi:MAG: ATP-binding cassette domain-containing protein [Bacteroidales bacterium]|nr:ATP-binding cassette domain-containing protein [Bacteroidales bacterium]MBN2818330.1 ATP-binding cassette domain-containing protein [Bacteroidales bacterium]
MSEQILKALMELFAIIARPENNESTGLDRRPVVESFLKRQLNEDLVGAYLKIYDTFFEKHQSLINRRGKKRIGPDSVKLLRICDEINRELTQQQKFIVLVNLFEFVNSDNLEISSQEYEFIATVSDSFYIERAEHEDIKQYVVANENIIPNLDKILLIDGKEGSPSGVKHLKKSQLKGQLRILHIVSANMFLLRYLGNHELYLNGQLLQADKVYVFNTGSSIRNHTIKPIYYSDVVSLFHATNAESHIEFIVQDIAYKFKNETIGLHPMSFHERSGRLVGIMGASGAGKSTLLNILNGTNTPHSGSVLINGKNIHSEKKEVEGLIGFVSQDDLLIEELSVFQNLYYNAKLCFSNYTEQELVEAVDKMLQSLGLYEIKDIQVGSPLNKKISGGQRKRLNIALELIREPAVLFLDEPTSGLSSRDSENIMDLLKELSLKGKLVFVVIHQPSSDIFKMFDKLVILDTGGYMIYDGDPIDSILYFKSKIHHANYNESECRICGNVNPEQIFNIVESNVLDEYGKFTRNRKISPKQWYTFYIDERNKNEIPSTKEIDLPKISFKIPNKIKQFFIFSTRDILSKLSNKQYLIINFLEAPVLAFVLGFIIKYFNVSESNDLGYNLMGNSNLPVYIFMSVIIAIFMGLTVSAEEIIKDRKILKREAFLNLSWSSYLFSKAGVQLIISAIQSFLFVIVGNSIMEIKGMYLDYWIILFSCWVSANMIGLVISDTFDTVVTIYILIPFLVIPQIILSGVIVKYEKLNPKISSPDKIPGYGEIITARWGYEALAVHQFKDNIYMKAFYPYNKLMSICEFKKDYWVKDLENKVDFISKYYDDKSKQDKIDDYLDLLYHEILKETVANNKVKFLQIEKLSNKTLDTEVIDELRSYLKIINRFYIRLFNEVSDERDKIIRENENTKEKKAAFLELKRRYSNDKLQEFVENNNETVRYVEYKGQLIQKIDPIYLDPEPGFLKAHFYAPRKMLFGKYIDTFWVNTIVVWTMSLLFYFILYFRGVRYLINMFDYLKHKLRLHRPE